MFPELIIPDTLAAGPGPGNTDPRVLASFARAGVADHMQADVVRGMLESKAMLREVFGTKNVYTYGVCGTGFSGLDSALSPILSGDTVVSFVNGTFSGIDDLAIRMKASTAADLAADPLNPKPVNVVTIVVPHGQSVTGEIVEAALAEHKPMWAGNWLKWRFDPWHGMVAILLLASPVATFPTFLQTLPCSRKPALSAFGGEPGPATTPMRRCKT